MKEKSAIAEPYLGLRSLDWKMWEQNNFFLRKMTSFGLGVIGMRRFPDPKDSETTEGGVSKE